jgi:hypothetical protein
MRRVALAEDAGNATEDHPKRRSNFAPEEQNVFRLRPR